MSGSKYPIYCDESIMKPKAHGTTEKPVQSELRWSCDRDTADRICCYNRHYAEHSGYWTQTTFLQEVRFLRYDMAQHHIISLLLLLFISISFCM